MMVSVTPYNTTNPEGATLLLEMSSVSFADTSSTESFAHFITYSMVTFVTLLSYFAF